MKPRITFIYNKKTTSLDVRIKIVTSPPIPPGVYSTGIRVATNMFDQEKQICGDISVQAYMNLTRDKLESMFRPGMLPEQMWANYIAAATGTSQTIEDAFNYYIASIKMEESTKISILQTKSRTAALLSTSLANLTPAMIRKVLNELKLEASTIHLVYTHLKMVIKRYVRDHNLKEIANIDGIISAPPKGEEAEEGEEEYLTFEEVQKLMALPIEKEKTAYARDLFVLTCFTGMAVADLLQFTTDWVSPDDKWLVYQRQKTRKTKRKCRVPIMPITRELIYKHKWPIKIAKRTIEWNCARLSKLINKKISTHTGRHSFGVIMLQFGFSMESVCKMMGHASILTTERIYAKVTKEKIEAEMMNIPKQMNAAFT